MAIITADDLKAHLKADSFSGLQHDTTIASAVAAANAFVVRHCGRVFDKVAVGSETARVYGLTGRGAWRGIENAYSVAVHDIWDTTNLVVKTDAADDGTFSTTWASTDYQLEPLNQLDGESYTPYWRVRAAEGRVFPTTNSRPAVQVTAAWGWTAIPDEVKQAALIKAAALWMRKDSPQGVAGFGEFGVVRISSREDRDVADLLQPFVHPKKVAFA